MHPQRRGYGRPFKAQVIQERSDSGASITICLPLCASGWRHSSLWYWDVIMGGGVHPIAYQQGTKVNSGGKLLIKTAP